MPVPFLLAGGAAAAESGALTAGYAAAAAAATAAAGYVATHGEAIARDLSDLADAAADIAIDFFTDTAPLPPSSLPWTEAQGLRPLPWHALPIPAFPSAESPDPNHTHPPLELVKGGPTTPVGPPIETPPEPPDLGPIKAALARVKSTVKEGVQKVTAHPLFKVYEYLTYAHGLGAILFSTPDNGPLLYDYVWKRALGLEDSTQVRTALGLLEVIAAESTGGSLAMTVVGRLTRGSTSELAKMVSKHLLTFPQIHGFAALGSSTFPTHQMTASDTGASGVDYTRAARTAFFFGATSILFFPGKDLIIAKFGGTKFSKWWMKWGSAKRPTLTVGNWLSSTQGFNWAYAQLWHGLGRVFGKSVRPEFIPSAKTFAVYALFATAYRNLSQFIASLPFLENSDWQQSLGVSNVRNLISIPTIDTVFYLGNKSNSLVSLLGNQLGFLALVAGINQFYNAFDGQDLSVNAADQNLREALGWGEQRVAYAARSKPMTSQNFWGQIWGEAETSLSVGNWTLLTQRYARTRHLDSDLLEALQGAMRIHLVSRNLGHRRVGMALGVLLTQVALSHPKETKLLVALRDARVTLDPHYARQPLNIGELGQIFRDIEDGVYDEAPRFQFPRI